jgi:hypothetical protein
MYICIYIDISTSRQKHPLLHNLLLLFLPRRKRRAPAC